MVEAVAGLLRLARWVRAVLQRRQPLPEAEGFVFLVVGEGGGEGAPWGQPEPVDAAPGFSARAPATVRPGGPGARAALASHPAAPEE